jgi:chromosomal replication initiation ATPase DnaA
MMTAQQLGFPFVQKVRYNPQDFLVTQSNQLAYDWIQKWPQWPSHGLILWGSTGCGKTHLAHVWAQKIQSQNIVAHWMQPKDLDGLSMGHGVILEDIEELIDHYAKELFHLYNILKEQKGFLLCTTKTPPSQWHISLADLSSRLLSLPSVQILPPDDDLLRGILHKRFSDLQIHTSPQVIEYMIKNTERSFEALQNAVDKIELHLQNLGGNVSIPLLKRILAV